MASYKVAQDVEADDKLLGPFSFRQFIYLIIVAMGLFMAYTLFRLLPPLAILPLPIVAFFGVLALPLRRDQPMETYVAAIVSFYLKPRKRLWEPDGIESLVEITVPKTIEDKRTKSLSENEAEERLSYLADLVDTRGWSIRNVSAPDPIMATNTSMVGDVYNDAVGAEDMLDDKGYAARSFESMINAADTQRRQAMINQLHQAQQPAATATAQPQSPLQAPQATTPSEATTNLTYNPYPSSMHQSVVQPISDQPVAAQAPPAHPANPAQATSEDELSPDIINLANNSDLSIETIAREANRIKHKHEKDDGEVVISLR